jgi:hypothetical protein
MEYQNVVEALKAKGLSIGESAKVRGEDGVVLYPVNDLYLYQVDIYRLAAGELKFEDLRAEYGGDTYPPNPYRRSIDPLLSGVPYLR